MPLLNITFLSQTNDCTENTKMNLGAYKNHCKIYIDKRSGTHKKMVELESLDHTSTYEKHALGRGA
jgi:hypothetical protein